VVEASLEVVAFQVVPYQEGPCLEVDPYPVVEACPDEVRNLDRMEVVHKAGDLSEVRAYPEEGVLSYQGAVVLCCHKVGVPGILEAVLCHHDKVEVVPSV